MEPIGKIAFTVTEQDYRREMNAVMDRWWQKVNMKRSAQLSILVPGILAIAIIVKSENAVSFLPVIIVIALFNLYLFLWKYIFRAIWRKGIDKTVKLLDEAGEMNLPSDAVFYPDHVTVINAQTNSVFPLNEITNAYEAADGLYPVHQNNRYLYFPARFFDQNSAFAITSFLQQALGALFQREAYLQVPAVAEHPGEVQQPRRDEETPRYRFDFVMTGKDMAAVAGRSGKNVLLIVGLLFTAFCGVLLYRSVQLGDYRPALIAGLSYAAILFVVVSVRVKLRRANQALSSKTVRLYWYDDHVTSVTKREGDNDGVNKINYVKLKKLRRQGKLSVVVFKDNSFLYLPPSAFTDGKQRQEFEAFIRSHIVK